MADFNKTVINGNLSIINNVCLTSTLNVTGSINGCIVESSLTNNSSRLPTSQAVANYITSIINQYLTVG